MGQIENRKVQSESGKPCVAAADATVETAFAVLRRKRSLESAAGSAEPAALVVAALVRVLGFSGRVLDGLVDPDLLAKLRAASKDLPDAVRADLPDWLWQRIEAQHGREEALRIAH